MKKQFDVTLVIPVTITVEADDGEGEIVISEVVGIQLPSLSDISDSMDDTNLAALDEAFTRV